MTADVKAKSYQGPRWTVFHPSANHKPPKDWCIGRTLRLVSIGNWQLNKSLESRLGGYLGLHNAPVSHARHFAGLCYLLGSIRWGAYIQRHILSENRFCLIIHSPNYTDTTYVFTHKRTTMNYELYTEKMIGSTSKPGRTVTLVSKNIQRVHTLSMWEFRSACYSVSCASLPLRRECQSGSFAVRHFGITCGFVLKPHEGKGGNDKCSWHWQNKNQLRTLNADCVRKADSVTKETHLQHVHISSVKHKWARLLLRSIYQSNSALKIKENIHILPATM